MPIGSFLAELNSESLLKKLIYRTFGVLELHTHIRLKPLLRFIRKNRYLFKNAVILELGCGSGVNLFETFYIENSVKAIGIDINCSAVEFASKVCYCFSPNL